MAKKSLAIGGLVSIILIALTAWGLSSSVQEQQYWNEQLEGQIGEVDNALSNLINICNRDIDKGISEELCDTKLKEAWDTTCKEYSDKMRTSCSKVENYLQDRGII